ncbi:MAG: isoprenylcysteine carboxylmethyltransferase family protein [Terriglobia bacterium]
MCATDFEFRNRFWFICLAYFVGFGSYTFDHQNVSVALAGWIFSKSDPHLHSLAAWHVLRGLFALSAALVTAAAWIRTWGDAYLRREVVFDSAVHTERLVADGPYRHLRNPLYFGNILLAVGMALLASRTGSVVLILGNLLIVLRLIGREETELARSQGEAYRAFLTAVPRLWPSLRPRLPAGRMQPGWFQAFSGEAHIWVFAIDGFLYVWKRDMRLYFVVLGASAAARILMRMVLERMRRRNSPSPQSPQS